MVRIVDYVERKSQDGNSFFALMLEGDLEMVRSKETGNFYATARKASITSTFNEITCQGLIGNEIPGKIQKVNCEPYEYRIEESGEVIELTHKYEYLPEEPEESKLTPQMEAKMDQLIHSEISELVV
ncbi:MAG: hypothetical protein HKN68_12440 [Saprospiraceae bacterium]|nr:hypothetical protein [Saprospiraceae bacterium]